MANRLTSASMGTTSASYSWDGDGLRTGKVVNGTSTSYTYDLQSPLPLVLDDGTLQYVWGAN